MENIRLFLVLLTCLSTLASDVHPICELQDVSTTGNEPITVMEVSEGCMSSFLTPDKKIVHIINLQYTQPKDHVILSFTTEVPAIVIFTSPTKQNIYTAISPTALQLSIYVTNGTTMYMPQQNHSISYAPDFRGNALLKWAILEFGGVTSFTSVLDASSITLKGIEGITLPPSCGVLWNEFPKQKPLLSIGTTKGAVKTCTNEDTQDNVHIINIPDGVSIKVVNIDVVHPNAKLVLRGPVGTQWNLKAENPSVLSNNNVTLNGGTMEPKLLSSDVASEIKRKAFSHFGVQSFSSYTEIHLSSSSIKLTIDIQPNAVRSSHVQSSTPSPSPVRMQLFSSSDYTSQLDPSTKVYSNKRIYAQVSSYFLGQWILIIKVQECSMHSKGLQPVNRAVSIKKESCSTETCHNDARFSFSLSALQDFPSSSWELACSISFCPEQAQARNCTKPQVVKGNVQVVQAPQNQCFEFGLPSILGIAFGGFVIGVLLIGALWFIKIRTGYPAALGLGSSGNLLSGCPCALTKRQPLATNPSPSESSANGSMSSTQSTPTSSMA
ncbi:endoglin [Hoplias malabaricus]|uniref:endoglin n=1 Tax=Hoplias malabaricus TaxID=27720 RepID=UPI003462EB4D